MIVKMKIKYKYCNYRKQVIDSYLLLCYYRNVKKR